MYPTADVVQMENSTLAPAPRAVGIGRAVRVALAMLLGASTLTVATVAAPGITPAAAAVDPMLGPGAPPGETFCYAAADNGNRLAFLRMIGAPGDPGFSVQVDRLRLAIGRSNIEALAIRPSGGIYTVNDGSSGADSELGRLRPGEFDPSVDNDAGSNPLAFGDFVKIADLNDGAGNNVSDDVDGLTFIETDNLITTDDVLLGSVRTGGDDTLITINPTTGARAGQWPIIAPPELVVTPDDDGIPNITADDVDDIAWDPEADQIFAVLGGSSLNYLGTLRWVLDDGGGGETTSETIPRAGGGIPDFSDVLRLEFVRIGLPAYDDVEGLGFSSVGATFGQFYGMVGNGGTDDDEFLYFDKATGAVTSLIDVKSDAGQGTGDEDYEALDCVPPVVPGGLTIVESASPVDGTDFTFDGGLFGNIGPGQSNDGLEDSESETKPVNPGSYVITQDALAVWSLDSIACTGDQGFDSGDYSVDLGARELTVDVLSGQFVTCTFTNSRLPADISVDKTVYEGHDSGAGCQGGENVTGANTTPVTYCFAVTNTGEVPVDVALDDGDLTIDETDMTVLSGSLTGLTAGNTVVLYYESTIQGNLTNTVTATGTDPAGEDVTDDDTASVAQSVPAINIEKTVYAGSDAGASCAGVDLIAATNGAAVTYCFLVTNTGDLPLANVTVDDPDIDGGIDQGDMTVLSGALLLLNPGASVSLYYETTVAGDLTNTATSSGTPPSGSPPTDDDQAIVDQVAPAISIDKTVYAGTDSGASCAGSESVFALNGAAVTYCFLVTNTGDSLLTDVQVDDADLGGIDQGDMAVAGGTGSLATLAAGETVSLYYESTVAGDLVNTGNTSATPRAGPDPTDDDTAEVDEVAPAISIDKTVYAGTDGGASCAGSEFVQGENGTAVTYCFLVTNTGDSVLSDVQVDDADLGGIDQGDMTVSGGTGSLATLAAGETVELYYESTVDGDLLNTASTSATPVAGPDPTHDDTAEVDELVPAISVQNTVYFGTDSGASCEGTELVTGAKTTPVTYCFVVTNTGDVPLAVTLADADLGIDHTDLTLLSGNLTGLAPGDSATLYYESTIDGDLLNTIEATGISPADAEVTDKDPSEVDEVDPSIAIDKTVYLGHDSGASCLGTNLVADEKGEPVTYCFEVTNTGDARLAPVTLVDDTLSIDESDMSVATGALAPLDPDDTVVLYYEATIDEDLLNTAEATGTPVDRNDDPVVGFPDGVTDEDTAVVDRLVPRIGVAKEVTKDPKGNGDGTYTLTYGIDVTNAGELDLAAVQITDDLSATYADAVAFTVDDVSSSQLAVNGAYDGEATGDTNLLAGTDTLKIGATKSLTVTVTVTPGDELGPYLNTAVATGDSPAGKEVEDDSDSGTDPDPESSNPEGAGDTGGTDDPTPTEFPPVDLVLTKKADAEGVTENGAVRWTISVRNDGPGDEPGPVTVVDDLPDELTFVGAQGKGWDCDFDAPTITCVRAGPLAAGASTADIVITTTVNASRGESVENEAVVSGSVGETTTSNNDDADEVEVSGQGETTGTDGTLPRTGATVAGSVLVGLLLIALGRVLMGRRREA